VDGVVSAPDTFQFDSFDDELARIVVASLQGVDDVVLGARGAHAVLPGGPGRRDPRRGHSTVSITDAFYLALGRSADQAAAEAFDGMRQRAAGGNRAASCGKDLSCDDVRRNDIECVWRQDGPGIPRETEEDTTSLPRKVELPIMEFETRDDWRSWLDVHHDESPGVWLLIAKRVSAREAVSYAEALEVALCYGWIDGQKRRNDDSCWLQKFTPRGAKSVWSKLNRQRAEELITSGQMRPTGLAEVERARADGRWADAYDSPRTAVVPGDLQAALEAHPEAKASFEALSGANRYAIIWRLQTAKKDETRERRLWQFIEMLERHDKLHQ
jgi:uncharacterized protein YdeI (YjbR/CyaY-like superfamily)